MVKSFVLGVSDMKGAAKERLFPGDGEELIAFDLV